MFSPRMFSLSAHSVLSQNLIVTPTIVRQLSVAKKSLALPTNSPMNVFDRRAKMLQKERAALDPEVKIYDYIKDEVGYRLSDRIFDIKKKFHTALDLGCGRGHVSKNILKEYVENLILMDMCPTFVQQAQSPEDVTVDRKIMDEENFDIDENSLDLIISCLNLHWVNDLPGCFSKIIKSLKNDGVFMAAIFGGETLYELRYDEL